MRENIEANFRARHPDLLDDPLVELPDNLRRFLVGLEPLSGPFGAADVSERFGVSTRTARTWLKAWREAEIVVAQSPGAQRVHKFVLTVGRDRGGAPRRPPWQGLSRPVI